MLADHITFWPLSIKSVEIQEKSTSAHTERNNLTSISSVKFTALISGTTHLPVSSKMYLTLNPTFVKILSKCYLIVV